MWAVGYEVRGPMPALFGQSRRVGTRSWSDASGTCNYSDPPTRPATKPCNHLYCCHNHKEAYNLSTPAPTKRPKGCEEEDCICKQEGVFRPQSPSETNTHSYMVVMATAAICDTDPKHDLFTRGHFH
ncbi:hypothetical protein AAFF_G00420020 [Aldrovandia affinis]|uniref:Uncharacterized protein n=1 Tax=Aldrovandia affinis TaxID=143900 RepID=A0AAD7WJC2_9TELE|nr:hypothetical protein AAFF_G00420020 [Aldrovandia affinis]